ncbi:hypothetical protein LTR35_011280 [Friedmanniomyces endolithicus]|uniref:Uncharacterized protein n=1 Tax=Friedmanniomyces endolithicus TaxID=329885 RepID=A0AAN6FMJ0_9PEZI|nr:hypothetical protein LTR35_011280 [Friedmanniomyces endolithicus]KAK0292180.1 hypothetical protein LTS00_008015 [Friedmanniomyces endolithicus]KAK0320174.1 hypothetical protein LTR82_008691 [Friedmanniomyces endolithicus]KAK0986277.1 hypothetical protein LTR54_013448 [Friedmanniomyces endolithicus]
MSIEEEMGRSSRELPVPTISRITSLSQANATLSHCWSRLWIPGRHPTDENEQVQERQQLRIWLENWEKAFTDFLCSSMASMGGEDLTQCRVLKANHLLHHPSLRPIVELAEAVLHARQRTISPQSASTGSTASPVDSAPPVGSLDIQAPLYIVMARCSNAGVWDRASRLSLQSRGL